MSADILGTSRDQCRSMVQYCFTSTKTRRLVRTDSPGRPPRLSHCPELWQWMPTYLLDTYIFHHQFNNYMWREVTPSLAGWLLFKQAFLPLNVSEPFIAVWTHHFLGARVWTKRVCQNGGIPQRKTAFHISAIYVFKSSRWSNDWWG